MISRVLHILLCFSLAIEVTARSDWYDEPVKIDAGITTIGEMTQYVESATIHVRIAVDPKKAHVWGLIWNQTDAGNFSKATISIPAIDKTEYIYRAYPVIRVETVTDGVSDILMESPLQAGFNIDGGFNSIKIVYDDGVATLSYGENDQHELCEVPFDTAGGSVSLINDTEMRCRRIECMSTAHQPLLQSDFTDESSLFGYLRSSADSNEGVWEYLDRNLDREKAVLGGFYRFATVRQGDGYDIIYIDGADINRDMWQPLTIKGRLKPTIFEGNYDMVWIDANGHALSEDVNAQISSDASIITLRFPLVRAEIRCRRVPLK